MLGSDRSISKGFTSNPYVNGILWSGARLPRNQITYSFDNQGSNNWGTVGVAAVEAALSRWESVADIEFVRVANNNNYADLRLKLEDSTYFANGSANSISLGEFNAPGESNQGEGVFNADELGNSNFRLKPGAEGFKILIHEIGHGLGLGHPHDTSRGLSTTFLGIPNGDDDNQGLYRLNQGVWTTMSYNNGFNGRGFESTPMALDIAAVQHLYGANDSYAAGNDTYKLADSDSYTAIWDTGGIDTITAIGLDLGVAAKIDLRSAPLTGANARGYISSATGEDTGLTIAHGVE
ncbi:MAG: matrixin family metalloprotease, partial [Cyanobacteria bacterium J06600_6]